jgi:hypothetical protein
VVTSVAGPLRAAPPPPPGLLRDDPSEEKTTVDVSPAHRHVEDRTTNQTTAVREIPRPPAPPRPSQRRVDLSQSGPPQHRVSVWVFLAAFLAIALAAVLVVVILLGKKH